ncbi:MAG: Hsp20/alpha crystallin family protein [Chitinophagaceae bacterium]|nr:Hsp20/alpha crystallin family protein [Chitinophagaceae bacterium]
MIKVNNPVQRNINSIFDELFNELPAFGRNISNYFAPAVNISENAEAYHMEVIAPGRTKEDFSIAVDKDLLTISYEKKEDVKAEGVKNLRKEFSLQSFKRSFSLDEKVNADAIQAKYENGILKVFLPKKAEVTQPVKSIAIQ